MTTAEQLWDTILKAEKPHERIAMLCDKADPQHEEDWLEFKQKGDDAHDHDRKNFSKSVAGFANTGGGLLIWGIEGKRDNRTGRDVAQSTKPMKNLARFKTNLQRYTVGLTDPPVPLLKIETVPFPGKDDTGFVLCLIPQAPIKPVRAEHAERRYWIRVAASFVDPPPALLRTLFYPQRKARLVLGPVEIREGDFSPGRDGGLGRGTLTVRLRVAIANAGPATATGLTARAYACREFTGKFTINPIEGGWNCRRLAPNNCFRAICQDPLHPGDDAPPLILCFDVPADRSNEGGAPPGYEIYVGQREFGMILFVADQDPTYLRLDVSPEDIEQATLPDINSQARLEITQVSPEEFSRWKEEHITTP